MNVRKILAILFCLVFILALASCGKEESTSAPVLKDSAQQIVPERTSFVSLRVDEAESQEGIVTFTLNFERKGSYELFYSDEKGEALKGYTKIASFEIKQDNESAKVKDLILPYGAKGITVKGKESCTVKLPGKYLLNEENLFIFGALSDVHYNRYYTDGKDDAISSFDKALDYFESIDADFVGIAGDISADGEMSAIEQFNMAIKDREFPVFTVTGNHDVNAISGGAWTKYMNLSALDSKECTFAENGLDFVYKPANLGGDVFVFLNQVRWEYSTQTSRLLDGAQLIWLRSVLEENKNETVYLFFHTFMAGPDGQKHTGVGNIKNPGGYTYPLPYYFGARDEMVFRQLMQKYKNVVYFSGHSHWMFEMVKYGEWANYSNFDGDYCHMVHVPSVTEPRYIGDEDTSRTGMNGKSSQGWIIYDYGETIILVPIDFTTGVIYSNLIEIIDSGTLQ